MPLFKIHIIISLLCGILAVLFLGLTLIYLEIENKEKSARFSGIATLACTFITFLTILNVTVPKPIILPLDNETRSYSDKAEVTLVSDGGNVFAIYYTLDGSDPKDGKRYEDTIILSESTTVCARSRFLFWWSDIERSTYRVENIEDDLLNAYVSNEAGKRETYSLQEINEGILGDRITFNSIKITDTDYEWYYKNVGKELPIGTLENETNFVGARVDGVNAGVNNLWAGDKIAAVDGRTYVVRLYVHNNSLNAEESVAENTKVRFYIPYGSSDEVTVNGWLRSSNAFPVEYSDIITFKSNDGTAFHLEYVNGSALLENGGIASGDGISLPDSITNQGNETGKAEDEWTMIGYHSLDGKIPGCYQYVNYVSIRVKVVYDH